MATTEVNLDYLSPEFLENPYPIFAKMRAESPVVWDSKFQTGYSSAVGAWHIFKYADIQSILRDRQISVELPTLELESYPVEAREIISQLSNVPHQAMAFSDPPKHTRLRSLVGKTFTTQMLEGMRLQIQENVDALVDTFLDNCQNTQKIEFMENFAAILPVKVLSDLIGFDPEDHPKLKNWVKNEVKFFGGMPIALELIVQSRTEFLNYIQDQILQRREHLGEDLLSALIVAQEEDDRLSNEELQGMLWLLLIAGSETTFSAMGNSMLTLIKNPEQLELLRENPFLIETAVEELLRYESPVQFLHRRSKNDFELQGSLIKAGQDIYLWLASANRDLDQFPEAERLDITRQNNQHLGFGDGIHRCLGASLSRLEMQIALKRILQRLPEFRLGSEGYEWNLSVFTRGLKSLSLAF
jgi:pimeloyl-[acyl-carrier protein] synthase